MSKQLASKADCCVLALSQLNRLVEIRAGKPVLSDLRESGSIEQDANQVMFVYDASQERQKTSPAGYKVQILELSKNRNGEQGGTEIYYRGVFTQFTDGTISSVAGTALGNYEKDTHAQA
jgi:replicative DNA helicase